MFASWSAWQLQEPRVFACVDHTLRWPRWVSTTDLNGPTMDLALVSCTTDTHIQVNMKKMGALALQELNTDAVDKQIRQAVVATFERNLVKQESNHCCFHSAHHCLRNQENHQQQCRGIGMQGTWLEHRTSQWDGQEQLCQENAMLFQQCAWHTTHSTQSLRIQDISSPQRCGRGRPTCSTMRLKARTARTAELLLCALLSLKCWVTLCERCHLWG